jgi:8-oxo-dGTP pyrophosphatase MutT (NUDIX family)
VPPSIPQFGDALAGRHYVLRPGGYGVIEDGNGRIAVVVAPGGTLLPGGGQDAGELPAEALAREAEEECGFHVHVGVCLGVADELVYSSDEQTYFRKRCTFFEAQVDQSRQGVKTQADHTLGWLPVEEALARLTPESQRWAVRTWQARRCENRR